MAINAKQVEIKFASAIDEETVIGVNGTLLDSVTFELVSDANNPGTLSGELSQDGKTLTVTAFDIFDGQYVVSTTEDITSNGVEVPAFSQLITAEDVKSPTLVSTSASAKTSTNSITLTFSEPVSPVASIVNVNGEAATVSQGENLNELLVTTTTALAAGSTANVNIINVQDAANNYMTPNPINTTVKVVADTTAPRISSSQVTDEDEVTVVFDKNVDLASFTNNARLLNENGELVEILEASFGKDNKTVVLSVEAGEVLDYNANGTFTANLLIGTGVKDTAGNSLASAYTKSVTFSEDTVAPLATGLSYNTADGELTISYSEEVTAGTVTAVIINEATGEIEETIVSGTVEDDSNLVLDVTLAQGTYTVRLAAGAVEDTSNATNDSAAFVGAFSAAAASTVSDTVRPVISALPTGATFSSDDSEQLVTYSVTDNAGVNLASVRNINNYTFEGMALPAGSYVTTALVNGSTTSAPTDVNVTIHVPSSQVSETETETFLVANVTDLAGNRIIAPVANNVTFEDAVAPELTSATVGANGTSLVVTFSEAVDAATVQGTDFDVEVNGVDVAVTATASVDRNNTYVLTAVNSTNFAAATVADLEVTLVDDLATTVIDLQGNEAVFGNTITIK